MSAIDRLRGELSVVTGASSGIGLAYCRVIAAHGGNLLMVSNQDRELTDAAGQIAEAYGVKTYTLCVDLSSADAAERVVEAADATGSVPMLLINNAGIFDFARVDSMSERRIDLYIDLHVRATTHLSRLFADKMARAGRGYILNMSSMSCWMPMPGIALYSATKAYLRAFTRALRIEMLSRGVKIMAACPGGISTGLFGLSPKLRNLGVALGVLETPERFARKALRRVLRGKAQYINGLLNRISIVVVASLPEWGRRLGCKKLLDK